MPEVLHSYSRTPPSDEKLRSAYLELTPDVIYPLEDGDLVAQYASMTGKDHVLCSVVFLCIEDAQSYTTDPPTFHAVWLDDGGSIVRQIRLLTIEAESFLATDGIMCDASVHTEAEPGPDSLPGGRRGPLPRVDCVS